MTLEQKVDALLDKAERTERATDELLTFVHNLVGALESIGDNPMLKMMGVPDLSALTAADAEKVSLPGMPV